MLDAIQKAGLASIAVGKIFDIFAGRGMTEHVYNTSNADGLDHAMDYAKRTSTGFASSTWWISTCSMATAGTSTAMPEP